jgi:SAM-dependent methyltransferase
MNSYYQKYASLYDIFYSDKPYKEEAKFIDDCFRQYGVPPINRVLELACGTGSHAMELEAIGYNITASDSSEEMIKFAKQKANLLKSKVNFCIQDMRSINSQGQPFDAIICLFDSIGYITSNKDLNKTFTGISEHLRIGGLFIFEFWHAAAMLKYYEPVRMRLRKTNVGHVLRISETDLDYLNQTASIHYTFYEFLNNGSFNCCDETHISRFFLIQEISNFLFMNGLVPLRFFNGFSFNEEIFGDTWHIVGLAEKKSSTSQVEINNEYHANLI